MRVVASADEGNTGQLALTWGAEWAAPSLRGSLRWEDPEGACVRRMKGEWGETESLGRVEHWGTWIKPNKPRPIGKKKADKDKQWRASEERN